MYEYAHRYAYDARENMLRTISVLVSLQLCNTYIYTCMRRAPMSSSSEYILVNSSFTARSMIGTISWKTGTRRSKSERSK